MFTVNLPEVFSSLAEITFLSFEDSGLSAIPQQLCTLSFFLVLGTSKSSYDLLFPALLSNVVELDLSGNPISSLPASLKNLKCLEKLALREMKPTLTLSSLTPILCQLQISTLDLSNNKLTEADIAPLANHAIKEGRCASNSDFVHLTSPLLS